MDDHPDRAATALRAARLGGETAMGAFRGELDVEMKTSAVDLVTDADRTAQARAVEVITQEFGETVVAEEEADGISAELPTEGPAWVIDPIDGTHNFVAGMRLWTTSVAAVVDGEPVAAANVLPAVGDIYEAGPDGVHRNGAPLEVSDRSSPETFAVAALVYPGPASREIHAATCRAIVYRFGDLRRLGSAQATLSMVASGELDAAIAPGGLTPWDGIAGAHLVECAGGTVTDLAGERWQSGTDGLVASNGHAHDEVVEAARTAAPDE